MRYLFILNPAAGKQDCTVQLIPQLQQRCCPGRHPGGCGCHLQNRVCRPCQGSWLAPRRKRLRKQGSSCTSGRRAAMVLCVEALTGVQGFANAAVGCLPYGSGNDFLRTYGTREEFTDLDAQLAGGEVTIDTDADQSGPFRHHLRGGAGRPGGLWHPEVPAYPPVRRRDGLRSLHCGAALRADWPQDRRMTIDGEKLTVDCLMCAVCNGQAYGGGFLAAPEADPGRRLAGRRSSSAGWGG